MSVIHSFEQNKTDYCNFNKIIFPLPDDNIEDAFQWTPFSSVVAEEKNSRVSNSLSFNEDINILNTTVMADMMVDIKKPSENTYPELGMLFIKSYLKPLLPTKLSLSHEKFYKIFFPRKY